MNARMNEKKDKKRNLKFLFQIFILAAWITLPPFCLYAADEGADANITVVSNTNGEETPSGPESAPEDLPPPDCRPTEAITKITGPVTAVLTEGKIKAKCNDIGSAVIEVGQVVQDTRCVVAQPKTITIQCDPPDNCDPANLESCGGLGVCIEKEPGVGICELRICLPESEYRKSCEGKAAGSDCFHPDVDERREGEIDPETGKKKIYETHSGSCGYPPCRKDVKTLVCLVAAVGPLPADQCAEGYVPCGDNDPPFECKNDVDEKITTSGQRCCQCKRSCDQIKMGAAEYQLHFCSEGGGACPDGYTSYNAGITDDYDEECCYCQEETCADMGFDDATPCKSTPPGPEEYAVEGSNGKCCMPNTCPAGYVAGLCSVSCASGKGEAGVKSDGKSPCCLCEEEYDCPAGTSPMASENAPCEGTSPNWATTLPDGQHCCYEGSCEDEGYLESASDATTACAEPVISSTGRNCWREAEGEQDVYCPFGNEVSSNTECLGKCVEKKQVNYKCMGDKKPGGGPKTGSILCCLCEKMQCPKKNTCDGAGKCWGDDLNGYPNCSQCEYACEAGAGDGVCTYGKRTVKYVPSGKPCE